MEEKRRLELLKWMDEQIEIHKQMIDKRSCGETVIACCEPEFEDVQIYTGIRELSRAAKRDLTCTVNGNWARLSFLYKKIEFFQLEEVEEDYECEA